MRIERQINGFQYVEECRICSNEYVCTWRRWNGAWQTRGCEICNRRYNIELYKRRFYLDLRNMVYEDEWIVENAGDIERINLRLRRTMGYAIKSLGHDLATRILIKCAKDYWNEIKGRWVHSFRS